jgi:hypothetical protein
MTTLQFDVVDGSGRTLIADPEDKGADAGSHVLRMGDYLGWFPAAAARYHVAHSGGTIIGRVRWVMSDE